ncbi:hypothetical protein CcaverHIS631_0310360 [Cutaneotrichosporon cavernicola]|nr:hypothetical protein CcaverHIS631_0310360 [Cutaneotrichosporon cavernicola]
MGLAERKVKQRIGLDPRNLSWSEDKTRFSVQHMANLGWKDNTGLGKDASGNANHIAVVRKLDNGGIGMLRVQKEGKELSAGAGQAGAGLEDVLKRLAARSASASGTVTPSAQPSLVPSPVSSPGPSVVRNKISSRQRHLASKRMASQDPVAMAAILGVPVSSLPTPSASAPTSGASTPASEETPEPASRDENGDPQRDALETVTTSTLSVADYFRQKLREKMLQRQASGSATPTMSEGSLAVPKEEVKVDVGGVAWEGSKMSFGENAEEVALGDLGADAPAVNAENKDTEAKKARKEAKRAAKESAESTPAASASESTRATSESTPALSDKEARKAEKEAKKREKQEKRLKKEEKAAKKAEKAAKKADKEARKADKEVKEGKEKKRKRDDEDGEDSKKRKSSPTPPHPPPPSGGNITLTFIRHEEPFTAKGWSITPFKGWINKWPGNRPIALWHDDAQIDPNDCPAQLGLKNGDEIIVIDAGSTYPRSRVISDTVTLTDPPSLVLEGSASNGAPEPSVSNGTTEPVVSMPILPVPQFWPGSQTPPEPRSNHSHDSISGDESPSHRSNTVNNGSDTDVDEGLATPSESPGLGSPFRHSMTLN